MKRKPLAPGVRFAVMRRDSFTCCYCGERGPDVALHVDHVRSVADGGTDEMENLATSCRRCNLGKGRASIEDDKPADRAEEVLRWLRASSLDRARGDSTTEHIKISSDGIVSLLATLQASGLDWASFLWTREFYHDLDIILAERDAAKATVRQ